MLVTITFNIPDGADLNEFVHSICDEYAYANPEEAEHISIVEVK